MYSVVVVVRGAVVVVVGFVVVLVVEVEVVVELVVELVVEEDVLVDGRLGSGWSAPAAGVTAGPSSAVPNSTEPAAASTARCRRRARIPT